MRIGLVVPPGHGQVPPEAPALYPAVDWRAVGLGVTELSTAGLDAVADRIVPAAMQVSAGAAAVAVMGTSLSFYRGAAANDALRTEIERATGVPAVTMASAIIAAMRDAGIRQPAVATAYAEPLNQRLMSFLAHHGCKPLSLVSLGIVHGRTLRNVGTAALVRLGQLAARAAPDADGLLISSGGLRTLASISILRDQLGVPVVTSATAGPWAAVKAAS